MRISSMGVHTNHVKGHFSVPMFPQRYTVCSFETPFLYSFNGELIRGEKGSILVNTPGNLVYQGSCESDICGFINDWFFISGEDFGELLEKYPIPTNEAFLVDQMFSFKKYAERVWEEYSSIYVGKDEKIAAILTEMMIDLHRAYNQKDDGLDYRVFVSRMHDMICSNPGREWNIQDMVRESGYSSSRFYDIYQEIYHTTPKQDLMKKRIEFAIQLLAYNKISISEIAETSGFESVYYFSKYFKKVMGCSPLKYRNNNMANHKEQDDNI